MIFVYSNIRFVNWDMIYLDNHKWVEAHEFLTFIHNGFLSYLNLAKDHFTFTTSIYFIKVQLKQPSFYYKDLSLDFLLSIKMKLALVSKYWGNFQGR